MGNKGKKAKNMDEYDDFLVERVEEAAREGASNGAKEANRFKGISTHILTNAVTCVITVAFVIGGFCYIKSSITDKWDNFLKDAKEQFSLGDPAEDHDLVLDNDGIFGFTAADFEEAILGDSTQLKKLEVYSQEISDVATIMDAGFANIKLFEKNQVITYHGTATYTVDLSKLSPDDVSLNTEAKTITLYIPHCEMETINIPEDKMEFGNIKRGWLGFGEIKLTPEQNAEVQAAVREKMEQKLEETKSAEQADRFAKMSVWEIYQPAVTGVSPECTLEVEFKN